MAVNESREAERKFEAAPDAAVPDELGAGRRVEVAEELHLVATYYDTPGLRLLRHGATLRHRTGEGDADGWHLKLPGGANARRELHVAGDPGAVPDELLALVRAHTGRAVPAPVAELRTTRLERVVVDTAGGHLAKLDDDTVAGRRLADGLDVTWRELEVELLPGVPDDLLDEIGTSLDSAGWHAANGVAKVGRVLTDGGDPRDLPPTATATKAARALVDELDAQRRALVTLETAVRAGDVEAVHDARVAARRLRSTLATFRCCFHREVTDELRDELAWFGQVLGARRDDDVLLELLLADLAEVPGELVLGPVREQIRMELRGAAQGHQAALVVALDSPRFVDLMDAVHRVVESPPWLGAEAGADVHRSTLRAATAKAARRMRRATPDDAANASDEALHEVRKAAKRARFAFETIATTEGKPAARAAERCHDVQEVLGQHQDSVLARQLLRRLGAGSAGPARNGFTFGLLHQVESDSARRARAATPDLIHRATRRKALDWLTH